jgi:Uncharacterised nucleotidyltransferase
VIADSQPVPPGASSLEDIAAALRKTTETFANEFVQPTASAPAWNELEWRIAEAVAAMHGVSSVLRGTLKWRGPARWQRFLDHQGEQTRARHERITELVATIDTLARRHGLVVVALKGAALYALGVYCAGERPMADVDLLVRDADLERAAHLLRQIGYDEAPATWKHRVFMPREARVAARFGEHTGNAIKIELHARVFERLPVDDVDITEHVWRPCPAPGVNAYPSIASLMMHMLLHASGDMAFRSLRMIQLHDIARLAARMSGDDWGAVTRDRSRWWALPPLSLTARYYPQAIPSGVVADLAPGCTRSLRRFCRRHTLTDVSLSNLWVEFVPGIEWSRTRSERVRYIVNRVWPDREMLAAREGVMTTHLPWMSEDPWTRMPRRKRMLRWISSRPPRVETMYPVTAVLTTASTAGEPIRQA